MHIVQETQQTPETPSSPTTAYPAICLPRLPAWKLSNGEMRSIWATNLERGKIERSALMRSTAWRNASS